MKIPSDIKYIRGASSEIEKFLRSRKISDSVIFDVRLSVEETIRNAIVHGNKNDKSLPISVSYFLKGDKIFIEIEDQGKGFDPKKIPDPTKHENLMKTEGRGVFLVHKLMDEVKYNDSGSKVFMVKSIKKKRGKQ